MKRAIALAASLVILAVFVFVEPPAGLGTAGWRAIGILLFSVILWVTEALPIQVTGLLIVALVPLLGVFSFADTWTSAINQAFFFILGSFGICTALKKLPLAKRLSHFILSKCGNRPNRIVFGFTLLAAVMSLFLSDSGAVILSLGFALSFLSAAGLRGKKDSQLAKCIMLALAAGAMSGGITTPVSNSVNILAISILEANAGISIDFIHWCIIGLPLAIIMTPLSSWALCKVFKPEPVSEDAWNAFMQEMAMTEKWTVQETKFVIILAGMVILWVASSWVSALNIAAVAIVGVALMVVPGIDLFDGKEYMDSIQVDPLILIPATSVLAAAVAKSGAGAWIVAGIFSGSAAWPMVVTLLVIAVVACIAHILIPIGPAVISLTMATMVAVAVSAGIDPLVVTIILSIWGGVTYTIPLDGLYVLTLPYEHYNTKDLLKYGVIPTAAWLVLCVTLVPLLCMLV